MTIINGYMLYDDNDIYNMLNNLYNAEKELKDEIYNYVVHTEWGMDRVPLLNIVEDSMEYNVDYLCALDSEVTEKFIRLMEMFGLVY